MRIFVYEHLSAGGAGVPAALRREGAAMLAAARTDFARIPGVEVISLDESDSFDDCAARADATLLIAPELGGILEQRSRAVEAAGGRLLGCTPTAIRLTADKIALAGYWQKRGISTPIVLPVNEDVYPVVLKPRFGADSQATFLVKGEAELADALRQARTEMPGEEFFLQHHVSGRAASVAFLIGPRQTLALAPAWQHLTDDGRFHYLGGAVPIDSPWRERAVRLGQQALEGIDGLQGWVGVDLVLGDDGRDFAIEINPRLTTSFIGLRQLVQVNLAEAWWRLLQGEEVEALGWRDKTIRFEVY